MSNKECSVDSLCDALESRLNAPYTRSKGLRAVHSVNLATNKTKLVGVAYHTSASDRGLMLNTCPWCGGQPGYFERE